MRIEFKYIVTVNRYIASLLLLESNQTYRFIEPSMVKPDQLGRNIFTSFK